ncbi:THO complex subunit 5B-like [Coffea arabica]|uniref:THO complex subunit 5B-like n=1 Tax=Coffea arabica TaxID=13443 RepID=A0A6P6UUY8_COFAR
MDTAMGEAEAGEILPERTIDMSAAYELLHKSKASVEEIVAQMLSFKKDSQPKSQLRELVTRIFLNFVALRQANRSILIEEDRFKAETERAKAPVDFTTLQLHNLMYEKNHYVKAIKACKDFKSKYPDIELVPEEEFFRDAPEDIKSSVISNDTAHNLMLKRLNFELVQRKELCKLRERLEQQKKALQETISNRKKFLSSLPSHLKSLKKASLPVQHQLGILHTKKLKQQQSAELLPPPLYVVYSQLVAQKDAFGENIDLEIVGSLKDAQAFARQKATKDSGISTNLETSRLDDDVPDEEDDGQRRRKRPRKVVSKDNLDQAGLYHSHPLKLLLHIHDDDASDSNSPKLISLKFEYLMKLNIVCVGIEGSQEGPENSILCNLFPDDSGLELPHQSAKLRLGDSFKLDPNRTSHPYKWAQHLAGIDFLPELSPLLTSHEASNEETAKHAAVLSGLSLYRQQNRVQTVVQRLRARKKAQLALAEQLDSLVKSKWPALTCGSVPWASHSPQCSLHDWSLIGSSPNHTPSLPVSDVEQVQGPDAEIGGKSGVSNRVVENLQEDGELPSLMSITAVINDVKLTPSKDSDLDLPRRLPLISKSILSPANKGKSPSFKRHDEDIDLILDSESELDEPAVVEPETDNAPVSRAIDMVESSWADCGIQVYRLTLLRTLNNGQKNFKLEAKIKIGMEYPLRPPLFALKLYCKLHEANYCEVDLSEWFNELRAMETEVNVHIIKSIPLDQENLVLAHQVHCLAMLFDFYMEDGDSSVKKRESTSVIDVGLCKPVSGALVARSFRGRDRRKMISWKDNICTPGYPY